MDFRSFLEGWADSALTSLGFFWMAFWAFCLGYLLSAMIQVFVTRRRMRHAMGTDGPRAVALASFFGFLSSSCSFAALSTTRALFQKGAGLVPSLAFLLASTNLVIELGIVIAVFLSWQFVVGEYLGGLLLIGVMALVVRTTLPDGLERSARENAGASSDADEDDADPPDWRERIRSRAGWEEVARRFFMEWKMVWKDVTFGFTVAGLIATFVPAEAFRALFVGSDAAGGPGAGEVVLHTIIGPLAAFATFIGSMGNIPLAGVLFASGVSFAGVMAFIFSDLVVFPVLRISARYFGWRMALYILAVFLVSLVIVALTLHMGFGALGMLPEATAEAAGRAAPSERFAVDHTLFLNGAFGIGSVALAVLAFGRREDGHDHGDHDHGRERSWMDLLLTVLAIGSLVWLGGGLVVRLLA